MRRPLAWISGAAGAAALARALWRRRRPAAPEPAPAVDPRAEELRRKLAESRAVVDERDRFEESETTVDEAEPTPDVEARRRRVHEQGRAATQQMRAPDPE
jgi:hypothetical protein